MTPQAPPGPTPLPSHQCPWTLATWHSLWDTQAPDPPSASPEGSLQAADTECEQLPEALFYFMLGPKAHDHPLHRPSAPSPRHTERRLEPDRFPNQMLGSRRALCLPGSAPGPGGLCCRQEELDICRRGAQESPRWCPRGVGTEAGGCLGGKSFLSLTWPSVVHRQHQGLSPREGLGTGNARPTVWPHRVYAAQ